MTKYNWDSIVGMGYTYNATEQIYVGVMVMPTYTPSFYAIDNGPLRLIII